MGRLFRQLVGWLSRDGAGRRAAGGLRVATRELALRARAAAAAELRIELAEYGPAEPRLVVGPPPLPGPTVARPRVEHHPELSLAGALGETCLTAVGDG